MPGPVTLVKLGGSLITDKSRPLTPRAETLARLAEEIVTANRFGSLIVGHGSGSFGHVAAAAHSIQRGVHSAEQVDGVAETQVHAHRLHRLVAETLWKAGARPFSIAPSSCVVATAGDAGSLEIEPFVRALDLELTPVTFGDVVMDRRWGGSICSTEHVFELLVASMASAGVGVERVLWLGTTDGLYDKSGETVPRVDERNRSESLAVAGDSADADVTGGMQLRVATALRLAERGVPSWIGNGLEPGRLHDALLGRDVPGTVVSLD
jgi:isopentenyl phosphate kinase